MNIVAISGNLTRDPELREINDDLVVCDFAVAVNQSKKVGDEWVDVAHFVDCSIFRGRGELLARKARKGDAVTVHGRLNYSSWETDEGKRSKLTVVADDVEGPWRFRKDEDVPARAESKESSSSKTSSKTGASKAKSADDDIPF